MIFKGFMNLSLSMLLLACAACSTGKCKSIDVKKIQPQSTDIKTNSVRVYKYDGAVQCEPGKDISPEKMALQELKGIKVLSQSKSSDGKMRIQVCGAPQGTINLYEIDAKDLEEAKKRGFLVYFEPE